MGAPWLSFHLPQYAQRGLRTGLGVFICMFIGFVLIKPRYEGNIASQVASGTRAAGITCVVVAAPVLGKVAQVGTDRIAGTLLGGAAGYGSFVLAEKLLRPDITAVFLSLSFSAFVAAFGSIVIGWKVRKLETTPRLFTLTFLLVAFGASDPNITLTVMVARIAGIVGGAIVSLLLASIVYPQSATMEALRNLQAALRALADLNRGAWQESALVPLPEHVLAIKAAPAIDGTPGPKDGYTRLGGEERVNDARMHTQQACEEALMQVLGACSHSRDNLQLAQSELLLSSAFNHLWLLPSVSWPRCGGWRLPKADMQAAALAVRRVTWMVWAVHLNFRQAFDDSVRAQQAFLARLLPELALASQEVLEEMAAAFPAAAGELRSMDRLRRAVEEMDALEEAQSRGARGCGRILAHLRSLRPDRGRRSVAASRTSSRASSMDRAPSDPWLPAPEPGRPPRHDPWGGPDPAPGHAAPHHNAPHTGHGAHHKGRPPLPHHKGHTHHPANGDHPGPRDAEADTPARLHDGLHPSHRQHVKEAPEANPVAALAGVEDLSVDDAMAFPETTEGQVAELRWGGFHFLLEDLCGALEELHTELQGLARALPHTKIDLSHMSAPAIEKNLW